MSNRSTHRKSRKLLGIQQEKPVSQFNYGDIVKDKRGVVYIAVGSLNNKGDLVGKHWKKFNDIR